MCPHNYKIENLLPEWLVHFSHTVQLREFSETRRFFFKKRKAPLVEQTSINLERYMLKHNYKQYPSKKVKLRSKSPVKIKSVFYIFLNIISAIISYTEEIPYIYSTPSKVNTTYFSQMQLRRAWVSLWKTSLIITLSNHFIPLQSFTYALLNTSRAVGCDLERALSEETSQTNL